MRGGSRRGGSRCFYDTNVLAAYMLAEEGRLEKAEEAIRSCGERGVSVLTLHELAYIALRRGLGEKLGEALLLVEGVFRVHGLSRDAALLAARLRVEHSLPEVDALIMATAVVEGYEVFYTFDSDFEKLNGKVLSGTMVSYLG